MKTTDPRAGIDRRSILRLGGLGALALGAAPILAACGSSGAGADSSVSTSGKGKSRGAVAMGFPSADVTSWNDQLKLMRPIIKAAGYELLTEDSQFDINRQVATWTTWINRGDVKAIAGWPVNTDAMVPVTAQAKAAGIPVFGYIQTWDGVAAAVLVDGYRGSYDLAVNAAKELAAEGRPENLTVVVMGSRDTEFGARALDGLIEGYKSVTPNAKIVEQTASTREDGYNLVKAQLTANPASYVWLGESNDMTHGAYQGLLDSGVAKDDPKYYVASRDATDETLDYITIPKSIYRTSVIVPAQDLAEADAKLLVAGAAGQPTKDITVPGVLVSAKNAAQYYVDK